MTDVLEIADELYGLDLADFTAARDARVKEHKGDGELPRQVKALRKPSLAAWVVNLLARREADQVDQLLQVGSALRQAQASMSGEDLRSLTRQRRQLTAAVTQQARALAADAGVRVTQAVADQVEATLTAAMVDEDCGRAVRSGLLVTALAATGVGDADPSAAVALPGALGFSATPRQPEPAARPDLHVVPDPDADEKALTAARERLEAATQEAEEARAAYDEAAADLDRLEARALQVQSEIDELKRRLSSLESTYEEVDEEIEQAEDARSGAAEALETATEARDQARAAMARLEG